VGNERLTACLRPLRTKNSDLETPELHWYVASPVSQGGIQVNHCGSHNLLLLPDRVQLRGLWSADASPAKVVHQKPLRPENPGYCQTAYTPLERGRVASPFRIRSCPLGSFSVFGSTRPSLACLVSPFHLVQVVLP